VPAKRASEGVSRATGAIERFIERTLAPRLEELAPRLEEMAGEIRGLRGEMAQMDKRITENVTSLRNEVDRPH
jgi:predicted  nucleic acid-binding Zn-ribbon protein